MNIDTLTHPAVKIGVGAVPVAVETASSLPDLHSVGSTLVSYGGALLASTLIHLVLSLFSKLKKKKNEPKQQQIEHQETLQTK